MAYTNKDGLSVLMHGDQGQVKDNGGTVHSMTQTLVTELDFAKIGDAGDIVVAEDDAFVTRGSYIKNAWVIVEEEFDASTAAVLTIGTYDKDGVAINASGIHASGAKATVDTKGKVLVCTGAQVGKAVTVGAKDAYVKVSVGTGPYTKGKGKLYVEYLPR